MSSQETESMKAVREAAILIPSLEPDGRLPAYIRKLSENGFGHIIVVDDGSNESYQSIFSEVDAIDRAVVLHHDVNHGKGVALKTGYRYILENLPDVQGVITADADGQHTVPDCIHLAQELEKKNYTMIDVQMDSPVFRSLGMEEVSFDEYRELRKEGGVTGEEYKML